MVTIWPSFISCLITSDDLRLILWASSATVIVSGTCTSMILTSGAAWKLPLPESRPSRSPRRPRGPLRQLVERPAGLVSPRVLISFFLATSSFQVDDRLADLTSFFPPGAAAAGAGAAATAGRAPLAGAAVPAGLCKVPFSAGLASTTTGSGFLATSTFFGADIISRMAAASASALRRRSWRSFALAASACFTAASFAASAAFASATFAAWTRRTSSADGAGAGAGTGAFSTGKDTGATGGTTAWALLTTGAEAAWAVETGTAGAGCGAGCTKVSGFLSMGLDADLSDPLFEENLAADSMAASA